MIFRETRLLVADNSGPKKAKSLNIKKKKIGYLADILVLATAWPEFETITSEILKKIMPGKTIIDPYRILKNLHLKNEGFTYITIGESIASVNSIRDAL
jgi:predicted dinucleotide-binding enzyme